MFGVAVFDSQNTNVSIFKFPYTEDLQEASNGEFFSYQEKVLLINDAK